MNKIYIDSKKIKKIDKKNMLRIDRLNIPLENNL
jgi:hypothetical protein